METNFLKNGTNNKNFIALSIPSSFSNKAFNYLNGHKNEFSWGVPSRRFHFFRLRVISA